MRRSFYCGAMWPETKTISRYFFTNTLLCNKSVKNPGTQNKVLTKSGK